MSVQPVDRPPVFFYESLDHARNNRRQTDLSKQNFLGQFNRDPGRGSDVSAGSRTAQRQRFGDPDFHRRNRNPKRSPSAHYDPATARLTPLKGNPMRPLIVVLLALFAAPDLNAQLFRQRVVCGPNGCYPVYQSAPQATRTVVRSTTVDRPVVAKPKVVVAPIVVDIAEEEIIAPIDDLGFLASQNIAQSNERPFIRKLRQATRWGRQNGVITTLRQMQILASARLPRLGSEMERILAVEFEVPVAANGEYDWDAANIDWSKLILAIIELLIQFGVLK